MISPVDLVKRVSVGGRLVPFFKCVCVYFVALGASDGGAGEGGAPSPGAVAAKCAPVLCLLLAVLLPRSRPHKSVPAHRVAAGLALSALGDALLLWPQHFVWGMAAFAGAHGAYIAAFGWRRRAAPGTCMVAAGVYARALRPLRAVPRSCRCTRCCWPPWRGAARLAGARRPPARRCSCSPTPSSATACSARAARCPTSRCSSCPPTTSASCSSRSARSPRPLQPPRPLHRPRPPTRLPSAPCLTNIKFRD
ncbi:unnamed protein product [Chrysodeixis includens]|uniref:lysoplasmalogenase n=1 Tax=Chrysodeixis includens TaxID=689277 RepID=A0A9N8Q1J1_CHRIL|nr:unnamed protein product [Chrysodeixis includens]